MNCLVSSALPESYPDAKFIWPHRRVIAAIRLLIAGTLAFLLANRAMAQATGGTITYAGGYTIHTFTSTGTFTVNAPLNADVVVVAGGGGGGHQHAGGGGAGGVVSTWVPGVAPGTYTIFVGDGGAGCSWYPYTGGNGGTSNALGVNTDGGGGGTGMPQYGNNGGSGGGDGYPSGGVQGGYETIGMGHAGSRGGSLSTFNGGGGGGAGSAGWGLNGGAPVTTWAGTFGGGGGGGYGGGAGGGAGAGNGGGGAAYGSNADPNTGSGGGGGGNMDAFGGNGGSGIVVIRYLTTSQTVQLNSIASKSLTQTVALNGSGFNQPYYQSTYADLASAFGGNTNWYWDHFQDHGFVEGRSPYAGSGAEGAAYSRSGLPVTFSVTSGPGTISGSTLSFTGQGTVVLRATQAGGPTANGRNYTSAYAEISITVTDSPPMMTVLMANPATLYFGQSTTVTSTATDSDGNLAFHGILVLSQDSSTWNRGAMTDHSTGWGNHPTTPDVLSASYSSGVTSGASSTRSIVHRPSWLGTITYHANAHDGIVWASSDPNNWKLCVQYAYAVVSATTPAGSFAAANKTPQSGMSFTVGAGDFNATFVNPYSLAVAQPSGAISYAIAPGSASGTPGTAVTAGTVLSAGLTYTIRATIAADSFYNSTYVDSTWTISKAAQSAVSVNSASSIGYGPAYTATAAGGNGGGAIVWALGSGSTATGAAINSSTGVVTYTGTGTVHFNAYRAGDTNYNASANTGDFQLTVTKGTQSAVTITSSTTTIFGSAYTATASGGSGTGVLVWALGSGSTAPGAAINASTGVVTFTGTGTVVFTVYRAADANYNQSATTGQFTLTVNKASQPVVTINSGSNITFGGSYTATATGGAGTGSLVWALGSGSTASGAAINASTGVITYTGAGTVVFTVYRAGDSNYNTSAVSSPFTLTIDRANQSALTISSPAGGTFGNSYTATANGGAGTGALVWALGSGSTATGAAINSSTGAVTFSSLGTVVFKVYRSADTNYNQSATTGDFTLTINSKGTQSAVSVSSGTSVNYGGSYTATATGGSGTGAYVFTLASGSTATGAAINSSTGVVSFTSGGTVVFNVYRAGDSNYNASAVSANFTLTVNKQTQSAVTINSSSTTTYGTGYTATATGGTGTGAIVWTLGSGSTAGGAAINASTGVATFTSPGTVVFNAYRAADPTYNASATTANFTLTVGKGTQPAVTVTSPASTTFGAGYAATATGGAGSGAIVWALGTGSTAPGAAVNSSTGAVSSTGIGTVVIKAYRATDTNYNQSATTANFPVTIAKGAQPSVSITSAAATSYGLAYTATASGGAGTGAMVWTLGSGSTASGATINPTTGVVTFASPGTVVFNAYRAGDANYNQSATTANFSLTISKGTQAAVTITSSSSATYLTPYTATASGGSGTGAIVWALSSGSTATGAAIDSSTGAVGFASPGSVIFTAYRAADTNYNQSATTANFSLTVNKANQPSVTITSPPSAVVGTPYTATAAGGSGSGTYLWALGSGSTAAGAAINPTTGAVSFTGGGSVVFNVYRAGDSNYNASATSANFTLQVKNSQTISFGSIPDKALDAAAFNLGATASSGLAVTYTSSAPGVASVDAAGVVTVHAAGATLITASQGGNASWAAAVPVDQFLNVLPPGTAGNSAGIVTQVDFSGTDIPGGNFNAIILVGDGTNWLTGEAHASTKTGSGVGSTRDDVVQTWTFAPGSGQGPLVGQSTNRFTVEPWGAEEMTRVTVDSGGANLVTNYDYYTTASALGNYRKIKSISEPNGNWVAYQYYDDWDRRGQVQYEFHPYLDSPSTVSLDPTLGLVISMDWVANWDGRFTRPAWRNEKVNNVLVADSSWQHYDLVGHGWPLEGFTAYSYDGTQYHTLSIGRYRADAGAEDPFRPFCTVNADLTQDSYVHGYGELDQGTGVFTYNSAGGSYFREYVVHGSSVSTAGEISSGWGSEYIQTIYLLPGKSTLDATIRDNTGQVVRTETWVYTGSNNFSLMTWQKFVRDSAGRIVQTVASNGATTTNIYTNGLLTSAIDENGIETRFTYDIIGRIAAAIKKGDGPTQPDIVTTYTYDGAGHQLSAVVSGTLTASASYDLSGRLLSTTAPGNYGTSYAYAVSGAGVTVTTNLPSGGTKVVQTYPDGKLKSVGGSGVISENHSYSIDNTGSFPRSLHISYVGGFTTAVTKTYFDEMGEVIEQRSPAYTGGDIVHTWTYNSLGQVTKKTQTGAADIYYTYDTLGRRIAQGLDINNNGKITDSTADIAGTDRISTQDAYFSSPDNGVTWKAISTQSVYAQNSVGTPTMVSETDIQLSNFTAGVRGAMDAYDIYRNKTTRTISVSGKTVTTTTAAPDLNLAATTIVENGLLQSSTDTSGLTTSYSYDTLGRPTKINDPQSGVTSTVYMPNSSQVYQVIDGAGTARSTMTYDSAGHVGTATDIFGNVARFEYDKVGQKIHEWGDSVLPVEYGYDLAGRKITMTTFASSTAVFTGSSVGIWPASPAPDGGKTTTWNYDAATGLLKSKKDATNKSVSYEYTAANQLYTTTNARLQTTTYTYSSTTGELTDENYGSYATAIHYAYNRLGSLASVTDDAGARTLNYNLGGTLELQNVDYTAGVFNGQRITYNIDTVTAGALGRPTNLSVGTPTNTSYVQSVDYGYWTDGRLKTVTSGGQTYTYNYNSSGLIGNTTCGNFIDARTYDSSCSDWLKTRSTSMSSAATPIKAVFTNTFDKDGRITAVTKTGEIYSSYGDGSQGLKTSYAYDARSQLKGEQTTVGATGTVLPGRDNGTDADPGFTYDNMGNRKTTKHNGNIATYTVNDLNQYLSRTVPGFFDTAGVSGATTVTVNNNGNTATNRTTQRSGQYFFDGFPLDNSSLAVSTTLQINSTPLSAFLPPASFDFTTHYDDDGNLLDDGKWAYTYDIKNQLISVQTSPTAFSAGVSKIKYDYTYDYLGRRVKKVVSAWSSGAWSIQSSLEERYLYNGTNLVAVLNSAQTVLKKYVWGLDVSGTEQGAGGVGGLLMIQDSGQTYLPVYDPSGNVHGLVKSSDGTLAATYEYDAFGNTLRESGPYAASNPFRYSTKYTDIETGLIYYGLRYYSPSLGRFINRDPAEEDGGVNLYGFCGNNTPNSYDYLGMGPLDFDLYSPGGYGNFDPYEPTGTSDGNNWNVTITIGGGSSTPLLPVGQSFYYGQPSFTANGQTFYYNPATKQYTKTKPVPYYVNPTGSNPTAPTPTNTSTNTGTTGGTNVGGTGTNTGTTGGTNTSGTGGSTGGTTGTWTGTGSPQVYYNSSATNNLIGAYDDQATATKTLGVVFDQYSVNRSFKTPNEAAVFAAKVVTGTDDIKKYLSTTEYGAGIYESKKDNLFYLTPITDGTGNRWYALGDGVSAYKNPLFTQIIQGLSPDFTMVSFFHTHPKGDRFSAGDADFVRLLQLQSGYVLTPNRGLLSIGAVTNSTLITPGLLNGQKVLGYP